MDKQIGDYLIQTLPKQQDWVIELEEQAAIDRVPIMDKAGMHLVMQLIRITKPKRILEIGTAIGYSALRMKGAYPDTTIVTIEKDENRFQQAINNIRQQNKNGEIDVIHGDALEEMTRLTGKTFNLIFIDAAKGQYKRFFELAVPLLADNGIIITDNVLFRGHVANPEETPKRYKNMVEKIRDYNQYLNEHPLFHTSIIPIGDGVAVSYKK
ncbi:O-methyltransferase [Oceanobacillus bengalensis]|uniref:tRNA 5-hydroxyuridine methyltransferase n=1 Tax=Oceanobacillus bengalensis TaxID=1435466 RepID=A0A494Z5W2_9BACI|nr:O-methyltransferase [Oceanobacillus bengalensis]RKQ17893.1 O-methyltransferase [Oceanobacillus bengalensis]